MNPNGSPWWDGRPRDVRRKEKVFIAVPTMSNRITIQLHGFLSSLTASSHRSDVKYHFQALVVNGYAPVEFARNYLVGQFLKTECSRLWFIDDDMMPTQDTLDLLETEGDIVCARMFRFDPANEAKGTAPRLSLCALLDSGTGRGTFNPIVPAPGTSAVQDVDAVGTGCTLIRRKVLEDSRMLLPTDYTDLSGVSRNLEDERDDAVWAPAFFRTRYKPNGRRLCGEDVDFSKRAKDLGYSVRVNLAATCGHYKSTDLDDIAGLVHAAMEYGTKERRVG